MLGPTCRSCVPVRSSCRRQQWPCACAHYWACTGTVSGWVLLEAGTCHQRDPAGFGAGAGAQGGPGGGLGGGRRGGHHGGQQADGHVHLSMGQTAGRHWRPGLHQLPSGQACGAGRMPQHYCMTN